MFLLRLINRHTSVFTESHNWVGGGEREAGKKGDRRIVRRDEIKKKKGSKEIRTT